MKKKILAGFVLFPWSAILVPATLYWHKAVDMVSHALGMGCIGG